MFACLSSAQVDTFTLDNIPTQKCSVDKYPITWEPLNFSPPGQKLQSTLTDIRPEAYHSLKTKYLGKPVFEEIFPEDVITKPLSRSQVKDIAKLDIQYMTKKQGLPGNSIYAMERDSEGNILFNTFGTLNSYDGTDLTSYYFNDSIGEIRHISARRQAEKWISTTNGVYYQKEESFYALKNNWGIHYWRATMDQEGVLWMTSYGDGVYFIKNDSLFHLINEEIKIDSKEIIRDEQGQIWLACLPGVIRMSARDTVIYRFEDKSKQASSIIEFEDKIYVGRFRKGMHAIKDDQVWDLDLEIGHLSPFDFEITDKGLWFTVYGQGLQLLKRDGHYHKFAEKDGLVQRSSHTLTSDDFGNIWVGDLFDGISIFSEANFIPNHSLPRTKVISDLDEFRDTTWFFYEWGAPIRKIGKAFYQMKIPIEFAEVIYLQNGAFENADEAWFQCYDYGFIKYKNDSFYSFAYSSDPQETLNHQVSLDRFGRIWAINLKNEIRFLSGDTIHLCHQKNKQTGNIFHDVKQLIIDNDQELYYNNLSNVFWAQKDVIYGKPFGAETIKQIFKHQELGVWVLTDQRLHHLVKDEIVKSYELELPKHCAVRSAIALERSAYLTTSEGFWVLNFDQDELTVEKAFGGNDFSRAKLFEYQNELMVSGPEFNHYYKSWWNLNQAYQPKLSVSSIGVSGTAVSASDKISLNPDEQLVVDLDYQDWGKSSQLQYQLIKEGNTEDWSILNGKTLNFDNLASGDYNLELKATNQSKVWAKTTVPFSVAPFWYESQWFFMLLFGILLLAFYFIYKYRVRRAEKMERQLQEAVDLKTKELAEEKKEVEVQLQQKELLLKEVNHRVMNNMQMVSSILELQNNKTKDPASKENLINARDRIKALALAHQHLYKNEQYETIKVKEYLDVIEKSLVLDKNVNVNLDIHPDLILPIERAQSLGLVLNELISNSIKHAWSPESINKRIEVELIENDNDYHWEYSDNGLGIQDDVINDNGLGNKLIRAIAKRQLSGDLEYLSEEGFKLKIKFPKL